MTWEIITTQTFDTWFEDLSEGEQVEVFGRIGMLEVSGPDLPRPWADSLKGSTKVKNLKELRIQYKGKPYRVFYAFDPKRRGIVLCGGRKDGRKNKRFYCQMVDLAENEFAKHLESEEL